MILRKKTCCEEVIFVLVCFTNPVCDFGHVSCDLASPSLRFVTHKISGGFKGSVWCSLALMCWDFMKYKIRMSSTSNQRQR